MQETLHTIIHEIKKKLGLEKTVRVAPKDREYEALREDMRGQFKQLKEKGLSIRIISL